MFSLLRRTMRLVVILLVCASGVSCREHARHQQHLKDVHSAKKFNIVTQSRKQDSMMVMMKGQDGAAGQNGTQGDSGLAGRPGPPGPAGFPGTPGVCTKEQCESNDLKLLIQHVLAVEKYVKENQNPIGSQPRVQPTPQVSAKPGVKICPTTPAAPQGPNTPPPQPPKTNPTPGSSPGQCQPAPAPTVPAGSPQGPNSPQPQPSKAAAPASSTVPAPAPAPGPAVPAGSPQGPKSAPPQPSKPAAAPVASPVPAPAQGQPAVPAGSPQVLWGTFTPSAASVPFSSPLGLTIQSTLEAPGTLYGGNGQIDIQGVVTPQVSVQSYPGNPGTASAAVQPGTAVKKSSISSDGAVTKPKHAHKKSTHHSRTHKS